MHYILFDLTKSVAETHETLFLKLMAMLFRHIPIVGFAFNGLEVVILLLVTRNGLENQKSSKTIQ